MLRGHPSDVAATPPHIDTKTMKLPEDKREKLAILIWASFNQLQYCKYEPYCNKLIKFKGNKIRDLYIVACIY